MKALVPTLPTPTTLWAMSTTSNRSSKWRRSSCKVARYERNCSWMMRSISSAEMPRRPTRSRIGTTTGGWLTIRFGARRIFLTAIVLFTLASLGCALSTSLAELVVMRVLQGVDVKELQVHSIDRVEYFRPKTTY